MKPQNNSLRLIVSCAIVFSLAVAVIYIQEFKENQNANPNQKNKSLYLTNQQWLGK